MGRVRRRLSLLATAIPFRSLIAIAILALLAAAAGAVEALHRTPQYTSAAALQLDQPAFEVIDPSDSTLRTLTLLGARYVGFADDPRVVGPAAAAAGTTPATIARSTSVTAPPFTFTVVVAATSRSRVAAQRMAQAEADALADFADADLAALGVPPVTRYRLTVVRPAGAAGRLQPSRKLSEQAALGLGAVGALLGFAFVQLAAGGSAPRRRQPALGAA